jgi:predicted nucleic acid-binding protein
MATLTDTGPIVALIDRGEERHGECAELLPKLTAPLVTTWPCVTEAMHLLEYSGGWRYQKILWTLIETGALSIHPLTQQETSRMAVLMEKYQDTPMDLADASLVATAESRHLRRVFTLDSDFRVYRANDRDPFEVVP